MPERLLKYRTASFIGFVGIFLFAMVGLARLPALGAAETWPTVWRGWAWWRRRS
jgi:hypothetical protein